MKKINVEITNVEEVKKIYEKNNLEFFEDDLFDLKNAEFSISKWNEIWIDFGTDDKNFMLCEEIDEKDLKTKKELEFVYGVKWDEVEIEWKLKFDNIFFKGE